MGDNVEAVASKNVDPSLRQTSGDGSSVVSSGLTAGFQCPICSIVLSTQLGLSQHIHVHNDDKPTRKKRGQKKKAIGRKKKGVKKSENKIDFDMPSTSSAGPSSVWSSMEVLAPNNSDSDEETSTSMPSTSSVGPSSVWSSMEVLTPNNSDSDEKTSTSNTNNDVSLNIQDVSNPEQQKQVQDYILLSQAGAEGVSQTDDVVHEPDLRVLHIVPPSEMDDFYESVVTQAMSVDETLLNPEENDTSDTESNIEEGDDATLGLMDEDPYLVEDDIVKGMAFLKMAASEEFLVTLYHYLLFSLSEDWKIDLLRNNCLRIIHVSPYDNASVTRAITWKNGEINIFIHNKPLPRTSYLWDAVKMIDSIDNIGAVADHLFRVAKLVQHSTLCQGIRIYDKFWKEAEMDGQGWLETFYEESHCFRTTECSLVVLENSTCPSCRRTKSNFKNRHQRQKHPKNQKFTKNINLSKEELIEKASELQQKTRNQEKIIAKLKLKIRNLISSSSANINQDLSDDLARIFQKHHGSMTEVQKLFWSEQLQALSKRNKPRTMRWNPFVIKIALHLQMISRSSYRYLQNFIKLPSERTLFDYTHVVEAKEGIQELVIADLKKQLEGLPREEYEQFFNILFDEVHIKSDIVISKRTGEVIGYTNLSEVEKQLAEVEASISKTDFLNKPATKVLMFMAQGVSTGIIGIVAMNKKFIKMHRAWDEERDFVYATENLASCDQRRPLFFVIDPPHVMKTVRNCLANSHGHKKSRQMFKNNEDISWKPIELLFEATKNEKFRSHKLTRAHIQLTSYGCMKVVLAAQVMSDSVVKGIQNFKDDPRFQQYDLDELCKFLKLMNDAFDCWNSHTDEKGKRNKWNPLLAPYTDVNDPRFNFLKGEFLSFFDDWKRDVMNRPGKFSNQSRERMFISFQSYESLYISVYGFCGAIQFMLGEKNVPAIDGRMFNQDKLEQHFGILRMAGGGNDNPNLPRTLQHIQDKQMQGSAARPTKKGNTEISKEWIPDERAIPKKKRRADL
ncbi:Transposable element P transposase [Frankliniella fusca]|uniref:Transposable element P transposase n=1 Tax=Frankliniella fusca TaxID=407009 RepID=A0AAE1LIL0_9NEOP|nr:Transposable element P transposase [Frankliniella fusca]